MVAAALGKINTTIAITSTCIGKGIASSTTASAKYRGGLTRANSTAQTQRTKHALAAPNSAWSRAANKQQHFGRRGAARAFRGNVVMAAGPSVESLKSARADLEALIKKEHCAPILVRLAWHDSGNYDKSTGDGGANASIRFEKELGHNGNAGLPLALSLLEPIKQKYPDVGYADLFQLASATAIEVSGGPKIPMRYGRVDAQSDKEVPINSRLPGGAAPFHDADGKHPEKESKNQTPDHHLRRVFYRMGLNDEEIVALSGAHTLGRAHKDRSGLVSMTETKYTKDGPGRTTGGMSWTPNWLQFDNSYFKLLKQAKEGSGDPELLRLVTDACVLEDDGFRPFAEKYERDEAAFFADYAKAHAKLSELGSTFSPPGGITI